MYKWERVLLAVCGVTLVAVAVGWFFVWAGTIRSNGEESGALPQVQFLVGNEREQCPEYVVVEDTILCFPRGTTVEEREKAIAELRAEAR
jgi:hypothetical protein